MGSDARDQSRQRARRRARNCETTLESQALEARGHSAVEAPSAGASLWKRAARVTRSTPTGGCGVLGGVGSQEMDVA